MGKLLVCILLDRSFLMLVGVSVFLCVCVNIRYSIVMRYLVCQLTLVCPVQLDIQPQNSSIHGLHNN